MRTTPAWHSGPVRQAIALGLLVFLSRLPFLGHGFGSDADAWRAIQAAQHLLDTGRYLPSRPPGYPLPEYVLALLSAVGLATPWVAGLMSAALSGAAASLSALILSPLGWWRAAAGALLLAFTPVVFVASFVAMDYIWGLSFFLAATFCVLNARWTWAAVWLGLAAASRPTYAACFLPLAAAGLMAEGLPWLSIAAWRRLVPLGLLSGSITLAFFVPVLQEIGLRAVTAPAASVHSPVMMAYTATLLLFGLIGFLAVAAGVPLAWWHRQNGAKLPAQQSRALTAWSWLLMGLYGALFLLLPDEASYLMPALLGLYALIARYNPRAVLAALVVAMLASNFLLSMARGPSGKPALVTEGPVLREVALQKRRACVSELARQHFAQAPANEWLIAAEYRPQLMVELGPQYAGRILYTVTKQPDGPWVDAEAGPVPPGAQFILLDRAQAQQADAMPLPPGAAKVLNTAPQCP